MNIQVKCDCGNHFHVEPAEAGLHIKCPDCGTTLLVPEAGTAAPTATATEESESEEWLHAPGTEAPASGTGAPATSSKAAAALTFGLFSFCLPVLLAVPALVLGFLGLAEIKRSRGRLKGQGVAVAGMVLSVVASVVMPTAFLWVRQYVGEAKARRVSSHNLEQLGRAMRDYQEKNHALPPAAVYGPDGKPLLSWRVLLLPHLVDQADLYKEFHLSEPWDSPHNQKLLARMPQVYAPVMGEQKVPGVTYYQVFVGDDTPFPPTLEGAKVGSITKSASSTILIVEAEKAVPWTQPEDLPYAPGRPLPKLGGLFNDGFHACFADGVVRFIPRNTEDGIVRGWISRQGNSSP